MQQRKLPLAGSLGYGFLIEEQKRADEEKLSIKILFPGGEAGHLACLEDIHKKCLNKVVTIVAQGQMGQAIFFAQIKEVFPSMPGAEKTGG